MLTPSLINMCLLTAVDRKLISFDEYCQFRTRPTDQIVPEETILTEIRKRYGFPCPSQKVSREDEMN